MNFSLPIRILSLIVLTLLIPIHSYAMNMDVTCKEILEKNGKWSSRSNREFYNFIFETDPFYLQRRAKVCGLGKCSDLVEIRHEIIDALGNNGRVLELGGGGGRVVEWLLENVSGSQIIAVEHSEESVRLLESKFKDNNRVEIIGTSILAMDLVEPVDVALWMWAGFFELNPREKMIALNSLRQDHLKDAGLLMIDFPDAPIKHLLRNKKRIRIGKGNNRGEAFYEFEIEGHVLKVHYISPELTSMWAEATGFEIENFYSYMTDIESWRTTAILRKIQFAE